MLHEFQCCLLVPLLLLYFHPPSRSSNDTCMRACVHACVQSCRVSPLARFFFLASRVSCLSVCALGLKRFYAPRMPADMPTFNKSLASRAKGLKTSRQCMLQRGQGTGGVSQILRRRSLRLGLHCRISEVVMRVGRGYAGLLTVLGRRRAGAAIAIDSF